MSQAYPIHLAYGRDHPVRRWLRAIIQVMMLACAIGIALGPIRRVGIDAREYVRCHLARRSAEAQCMAFAAPHGSLIVDETPLRAAAALVVRNALGDPTMRVWNPSDTPAQSAARNAAIRALSHPNTPDCWREFQTYAEPVWGSAGRVRCLSCLRSLVSFFAVAQAEPVVIMLHGRRAPGGPSRLVCLRFDLNAFEYTSAPSLQAFVYADGLFGQTLLRWSGKLQDPLFHRQAQTLKIYAGEADPRDEARFTIPFCVGAEAHVLTGRLTADDHVAIRVD